MSDVAFSGLGSFVLFLFISSLFGMLLLIFCVRHPLLKNEMKPTAGNSLIIQAALIPFLSAIMGLIALEIFDNQPNIEILFDQFMAFAIVGVSILSAIIYLFMGFKKINRKIN